MQNYTAAEAEVQLYSILMCDKKNIKCIMVKKLVNAIIFVKIFMLIMDNL